VEARGKQNKTKTKVMKVKRETTRQVRGKSRQRGRRDIRNSKR
jgi:hypothetical protein